ncbi:MAG TPA: YtxH domain-containing protein, partial [Blastocatellia bacterium]|nr:YtxH domain-containing protein [Blastocatellia bacterium]
MNKGLTILGAMGIGAGLMYVFDPDKGKKRRALMRDRLEDTARKTRRQIDRKSHEVGDLVSSIGASIKAPFTNGPLSDNDLLARVKEKVIEILPDTQDIKVRARNGIVTLGGWLPQR